MSDGSKVNANITDEGRGAKGQEEQVGRDGSKANSKDVNIADEGLGATGQEKQVEGMVFKVGGKY